MKIRETMSRLNEIQNIDSRRYVRAKEVVGEERIALMPDSVNLSREAMDRARFERVLKAVNEAPEVDRLKVADIKKAIAEGTYKPEAKDGAQKIAEEWSFYASLYASGGDDHGEA